MPMREDRKRDALKAKRENIDVHNYVQYIRIRYG